VGWTNGVEETAGAAIFFAACLVALNFCQRSEVALGGCPAGFIFASDFNCPLSWRSENGTAIRGATNNVCTNNTVAKKVMTAVMRRKRRSRGHRFPRGSENTNGVTPGGMSSGIKRYIARSRINLRAWNMPV
jgi:hypothetical protein